MAHHRKLMRDEQHGQAEFVAEILFDAFDVDAFFITEPSLNLLLNVTRHLRVGFGASYRFVGDVELNTLENS